MDLEKKINEELKNSMKSGDKLRTETLRSIRAAIIEFNKSGAARDMNPDDEIKILQNGAKKRKDAIEIYEKAGRMELADKEKSELRIINEFLPDQLGEDEVTNIISNVIKSVGAESMKDIGKVMGPVMKELKGKADGSLVQSITRKLLEN